MNIIFHEVNLDDISGKTNIPHFPGWIVPKVCNHYIMIVRNI